MFVSEKKIKMQSPKKTLRKYYISSFKKIWNVINLQNLTYIWRLWDLIQSFHQNTPCILQVIFFISFIYLIFQRFLRSRLLLVLAIKLFMYAIANLT
jgi:hypothetical protein